MASAAEFKEKWDSLVDDLSPKERKRYGIVKMPLQSDESLVAMKFWLARVMEETKDNKKDGIIYKIISDSREGKPPSPQMINLLNFVRIKLPFLGGDKPLPSGRPTSTSGGPTSGSGPTSPTSGGGGGSGPTSTEEELKCPTPLSKLDVSFNDIAGIQSVKDQMTVNYIYPFVFPGLFPEIAKGTLLYGPPGTGKSSIAKAATKEIPDNVFYSPQPSTIKGKYLGETEKNITKLFECADTASKMKGIKVAIIFMDEFEAIGGDRNKSEGAAASVNALLQQMDGVVARDKVSVLAATNYPWCLDSAILRRLTTRILVPLPDPIAIEFLIRQALANAYSTPGEGKRTAKGKIDVSEFYYGGVFTSGASYMENIQAYGGGDFKSKQGGWLSYLSTESSGSSNWKNFIETQGQKPINDSAIKALVDELGPTKTGRAFLDDWNSGKNLDFSDKRLQETAIFGYSPADISKLMKYAINKSSMEALSHGYNEKEFGGKIYYVADMNKTSGPLIKNLPQDRRDRAITFTLRTTHLADALKMNKSTVDSIGYFRMLFYERNQSLPEDQMEATCG